MLWIPTLPKPREGWGASVVVVRSSVVLVFVLFVLVGAPFVTITIVIVATPMDLDVPTLKITRGAVAV